MNTDTIIDLALCALSLAVLIWYWKRGDWDGWGW